MKKYAIIAAFFAALSSVSRAQFQDKDIIGLQQLVFVGGSYDHADSVMLRSLGSGVNGLWLWRGSDEKPVITNLGANLGFNSGTNTLEVVSLTTASLTDMTATGISMATAANAGAARTSLGLGTAATTASSAYATAAQGATADTAVQPAGLTWANVTGKPSFATVATSGAYADLTGLPSIPGALSSIAFNHTPNRSTVTTAAAANGFQPHASKYSVVNYSVTINTTVSLSGNSTGYVVLEIAATNSATAGDWNEIGRTPSGQSGTLVVGLTLNQVGGGQVGGMVPAGWYARLRSVNTAGTPTYTYNSGQEVQPPQ
jgi:hypothetical protein